MTSLHFVVHPLPGTEDQLNDRYDNLLFEKEKRKNEWATIGEQFLMWLLFLVSSFLVLERLLSLTGRHAPI